MSVEKFKINQRKLSIISFSLFFGWLLAVPFEGQVLYTIMENAEIQGTTHNTIAICAHFIGLACCGIFVKNQPLAKMMMITSTIICISGSLIFFLSYSILWYFSIGIISFFSALFVASWGFYYKAYSQAGQCIKTVADVLIYSNIFMIFFNVVAVNVSGLLGLGISIMALIAVLPVLFRLEAHSDIKADKTINKKTLQHNRSNILKPLVFLCVFIFIITLNSGLMYQVVNPAFQHLVILTSYYWAVPYIVALYVLRSLPDRINRAYILYAGLIMIGFSFVAFMWLDRSITSYLIINTLMLGAFGICDLFWWSIFGSFFNYSDNPAQVLGIGLSMNVLGILAGGFVGKVIISVEREGTTIFLIALVVIFTVMILLPLLNAHLTRLFKNHAFLIRYEGLVDGEQEKVIANVWEDNQLTQKEIEVIKLLLQGYTYKAISGNLFITENTTKFHVKNIYQKLRINNKMELIKLFAESEKE